MKSLTLLTLAILILPSFIIQDRDFNIPELTKIREIHNDEIETYLYKKGYSFQESPSFVNPSRRQDVYITNVFLAKNRRGMIRTEYQLEYMVYYNGNYDPKRYTQTRSVQYLFNSQDLYEELKSEIISQGYTRKYSISNELGLVTTYVSKNNSNLVFKATSHTFGSQFKYSITSTRYETKK